MNVLTEKNIYIEYVYSDKHDKNLIEFKKKEKQFCFPAWFLKSVNQGILKPWQVTVTKSDKLKTHLRHLACTYSVTPGTSVTDHRPRTGPTLWTGWKLKN